MKRIKRVLPKGTTFMNTNGNPARVIEYKRGDRCYRIKHDSGIFVHEYAQVHRYIFEGKYTRLKLPSLGVSIDETKYEPEYELY